MLNFPKILRFLLHDVVFCFLAKPFLNLTLYPITDEIETFARTALTNYRVMSMQLFPKKAQS